MDVFAALEERIEKLIVAHNELRDRVAELETERAEVRARLERLLESVSAIEL